jgi:hypothetical protein
MGVCAHTKRADHSDAACSCTSDEENIFQLPSHRTIITVYGLSVLLCVTVIKYSFHKEYGAGIAQPI